MEIKTSLEINELLGMIQTNSELEVQEKKKWVALDDVKELINKHFLWR